MNIGIVIGRIGGTDGVALETQKWIEVLNRLGHKVFVITGELRSKIPNTTVLPELSLYHTLTVAHQNHAFFKQNVNEDRLLERLIKQAAFIENNLQSWLYKNKLDLIISENANALPCHLTMGMALGSVIKKTGIPCITHDHDFVWERRERYKTKYAGIKKIIKDNFPLVMSNVTHAVINKNAQNTLRNKFKIKAHVVPNVMDFKKPFAKNDNYNNKFRKALNLRPDDITLLQITRIVPQKGIDTAIQLIHELNMPNVKLVITGNNSDDYGGRYFKQLSKQVQKLKIKNQIIFAGDYFDHHRGKQGQKLIFSLEDGYANATACTYFSTYEGFGNAFVETILAKKPIFVNNYKPVYWPDIGSLGFQTVMIENSKLTKKAIEKISDIIQSPQKRKEIAEHNYKLGSKVFSFEILENILEYLINRSVKGL